VAELRSNFHGYSRKRTTITNTMNLFFETILDRNDGRYLALLGGSAMMLLAVGLYVRGSKSKYPLPPGPKGSPIIGNLRQVPAERSDVQFSKWAKEFSELDRDVASIVKHISLMGTQNLTSSTSTSSDNPSSS